LKRAKARAPQSNQAATQKRPVTLDEKMLEVLRLKLLDFPLFSLRAVV